MGDLPVVILAIVLAAGLAACSTSRPRAHLISEAGNLHPRYWKLDDLPITVAADPNTPKAWIPHLKTAVDAINKVIPDTLVWADSSGAAVATYTEFWGFPPDRFLLVQPDRTSTRWLAYTTIFHNDGIICSAVTYLRDDVANTYLAPQTVLHELLHALGVDHDHVDGSVMNPTMTAFTTEFTSATKDLLIRTYGR